jgi:hypothetical protein
MITQLKVDTMIEGRIVPEGYCNVTNMFEDFDINEIEDCKTTEFLSGGYHSIYFDCGVFTTPLAAIHIATKRSNKFMNLILINGLRLLNTEVNEVNLKLLKSTIETNDEFVYHFYRNINYMLNGGITSTNEWFHWLRYMWFNDFNGYIAEANILNLPFQGIKEKPKMKQYVYFLVNDYNNTIKVGITNDIKRRQKTLEAGCGQHLNLIGLLEGDFELEKKIHTALDTWRNLGEWFDYNDDTKSIIDEYIKTKI